MMGDLISRNELLDEIKYYQMDIVAKATAMTVIRNAPTVDAVPVVHAEWEYHWFDSICSNCGYRNKADSVTRIRDDHNFCPDCGADMRKKAQE